MKPVAQNLSSRIDAVVNLAGYWSDSMPKKPNEGVEPGEWEGLVTLLNNFSAFAADYKEVLRRAPALNQHFVMNNGTDRLLKNFDILSRASEQRRGAISKNGPKYYLAQAENQLTQYCNQWCPNTESDSPYVALQTPVVYFEKIYAISRALYSPEIPVISIPLTEYNDPSRWLALAHEMGHHIYWNSLKDLEQMAQLHDAMYKAVVEASKLSSDEMFEPWGIWQEEVFADICGVLFAGPAYVMSAQNLAAETVSKLDDFSHNDGEHPSAYLRPWIAYEALCRIQNQNRQDETFLKNAEFRWRTYSKGAESLKCKCGKKREATLETLQEEVGPIVDVLLNQRIWPDKKNLRDLIQYHPLETSVVDMHRLPELSALDPWPYPEPSDTDIPQQIRGIWRFLQERLPANILPAGENRSKTLWNALIHLDLDDEHGHGVGNAHQDWEFHPLYFWARLHYHDPNTGETRHT